MLFLRVARREPLSRVSAARLRDVGCSLSDGMSASASSGLTSEGLARVVVLLEVVEGRRR